MAKTYFWFFSETLCCFRSHRRTTGARVGRMCRKCAILYQRRRSAL